MFFKISSPNLVYKSISLTFTYSHCYSPPTPSPHPTTPFIKNVHNFHVFQVTALIFGTQVNLFIMHIVPLLSFMLNPSPPPTTACPFSFLCSGKQSFATVDVIVLVFLNQFQMASLCPLRLYFI